MNAAAAIAPADMIGDHIVLLEGLSASPRYPAAWVACAEEAGASLFVRKGIMQAGWPYDEYHVDRGHHLSIIAHHMDEAGQRAAVITFLEKRK